MKRKIMVLGIALLAFLGTAQAQKATTKKTSTKSAAKQKISFKLAENYFIKNDYNSDQKGLAITDEQTFTRIAGPAASMGDKGQPTKIDFSKQFVILILLPQTEYYTTINVKSLAYDGKNVLLNYGVKKGEKITYTMRPSEMLVVDKKYMGSVITTVSK